MIQCPHCSSSEQQTKSGPTRTGSQRYKCRECQRIYGEGTNFRRIGRILSVNHQSVVNRVNSHHVSLPAAEQSPPAPETLEMDELFTFIGSKKRKPTS